MLNAIKVRALRSYYRFTNKRAWRGLVTDVPFENIKIKNGAKPVIGARLYKPSNTANKPMIVYFHGGGWVIGDLETHHPFCARLSEQTGCPVISVDYRLAPEHPFPAAQNDCLASVRDIAENISTYGDNNGQIILAGDSAGANLALSTALELGDLRNKLSGIISLYPVADHYSAGFASYPERVKGQILNDDLMVFFWDNYLKDTDHSAASAKRVYPLQAGNLAALPRTLMVTAQFDPLRDEGKALGDKLKADDVYTTSLHYNELHGFACGDGLSKSHLALMDEIVKWTNA